MTTRLRFTGHIAGVGTGSGTRLVVGRWAGSPYGSFADVMVERPDGHRVLLAPTEEVAGFVAATYAFDEVRVVPVGVTPSWPTGAVRVPTWRVSAGPLELDLEVGGRTPLGWLLRAVPAPVATAPLWLGLIDPLARRLQRGVRTSGSAGGGRHEWYGARDVHRVVRVAARWEGADLGGLAPVDPPVRFGAGSTPRRPVVVAVTTTVASPR